MTILSWNIRQGGGKRAVPISQYLRLSAAHVLVLSEFRNNAAGLLMRKRMLDAGYVHQVTHADQTGKNGVCILSKMPFQSRSFHPQFEFGYGLLQADFGPFRLVGAYLPHKKRHRLFEPLIDLVRNDAHVVLAGDLNTGHNFVDQKGDSFWYTAELAKLEQDGLRDAFRHMKGRASEFSWYSHGGNGFRYDHSYVSSALLPIVEDCHYDHAPRLEGLSDHSAMVLKLGSGSRPRES